MRRREVLGRVPCWVVFFYCAGFECESLGALVFLRLTNLLVYVERLHGGYSFFFGFLRRVTFSRGCLETCVILLSQGERRRGHPLPPAPSAVK